MAVARHRDIRQQAGVQPVTDRVEHGHVRDVAVERVVEDVTADLVRRGEQSADDDPVRAEGQRGQGGVLHLCGQRHGCTAPGPLVHIGVGPVDDQQLGDQVAQVDQRLPQLDPQRLAFGGDDDLEHSNPLDGDEHRQPQATGVPRLALLSLQRPESAARERPVDRQLGARAGLVAGQGGQAPLLVIDQVQHDLGGAQLARRRRGEVGQLVGGHQVRAGQQHPECSGEGGRDGVRHHALSDSASSAGDAVSCTAASSRAGSSTAATFGHGHQVSCQARRQPGG